MAEFKLLLSAVAIALTFIAFYPYIRGVLRGVVKPHVFSWVIWGSTTFIVFLAQMADGGGAGAWPIGVSGVVTLFVAMLAFLKRGDVAITRLDWLFFVAAMGALPLWYFTASPLAAVIVLTVVDLLGFGPTFRKAYHQPYDEQLLFFVLMGVRNLVSIAALERYSAATITFPLVIAMACGVFILMVLVRRRAVAGGR